MKYINLKKLVDWLHEQYESSHGVVAHTIFAIFEHLMEMQEVRGTWEEYSNESEITYICSECHCNESKPTPFCPHCGLPMKEAGA